MKFVDTSKELGSRTLLAMLGVIIMAVIFIGLAGCSDKDKDTARLIAKAIASSCPAEVMATNKCYREGVYEGKTGIYSYTLSVKRTPLAAGGK